MFDPTPSPRSAMTDSEVMRMAGATAGNPADSYETELQSYLDRIEVRRGRIHAAAKLFAKAALIGGAILATGWMAGRANSPRPPIRVLPGEFERHEGLLVAWHSTTTSPPETIALHREFVTGLVAAVKDNIQVVVLTLDKKHQAEAMKALEARGIATDRCRWIEAPTQLIWVRDNGPLITKTFDGGYEAVDTVYDDLAFPGQDAVPGAVSSSLRLPLKPVPLVMDNGNLLSNGSGLCITTQDLIEKNRQAGRSPTQTTAVLKEALGIQKLVVLEALSGEPLGHVDMFATFTAPDTVVIGEYSPDYDWENAALLDRNAARLSGIRTAAGPLKVYRVPMPERLASDNPEQPGGHWCTYTNVVYANGLLLLPSYGSGQRDSESAATKLFQKLLPGWTIVPIDGSQIIRDDGGPHCATMNLVSLSPGLNETDSPVRER